jgi:hypothetical protein
MILFERYIELKLKSEKKKPEHDYTKNNINICAIGDA